MDDYTRDQLHHYITELFAPEDDAQRWIQAEAARSALPAISVRPYEGCMLQWLAHTINARKIVEIGTLAGYSAVWLARALPADGKLYTLERSSKHAQIARASFARAGVADKIELLEGVALDSLRKLHALAPFDLVFVDADKGNLLHYMAWALDNLRVGGMLAAHNAFRSGRILSPEDDDDRAMQVFNRALAEEKRLESTILPVGDGMAVAIKRA
ncbi:MAG: O-methyltransferase [Chloroflexi bacterium]|nr:O-methyltransferase [Chloroflexota bacterium]